MSVVYQSYGSSGPGFNGWAFPEKHLGRNARLFYTLEVLSVVPEAVRNFLRQQVPEDVIRATLNLQLPVLDLQYPVRSHAAGFQSGSTDAEMLFFPCVSSGKDGFYFLFGRDYENPADAPHDTSYRRAMLSVLERGDRLRLGGMLFLEEDLMNYFEEPYRKRFVL